MTKRYRRSIAGFLLPMFGAIFAVVLFAAAPVAAPDAAYVESFEKWKAEQTADLKQNWLTLAGLFWLKPGPNTFGSDPSNPIVFPKVPAHAGQFDLAGKEVTLIMSSYAKATIEGKPVSQAK